MTSLAHTLDDLYVRCMNCVKNSSVCPGVWKDIPAGIPPRGFYYRVAPIKLLVVAKNPGHPLQGEPALLKGRTGCDLFHAYRRFQDKYYNDPAQVREPSTRFHKTLFRYIAYFLDIPQADIYIHAAHTNLVKCSTPDEQARLHPETMAQCYEQYFRMELDLLNPKVLLALGREVERFLIKMQPDHGLPVIYIKHPAYRYRKEDEAQILDRIRGKIRVHL